MDESGIRRPSRRVTLPGPDARSRTTRLGRWDEIRNAVEIFRKRVLAGYEVSERAPDPFINGNRRFHLHELLKGTTGSSGPTCRLR
jgi:hypothetical protein